MPPGSSISVHVTSPTTSATPQATYTNTVTVTATNQTTLTSSASVTVQQVNPSGSYPTQTTCQAFISDTALLQENGQYSVKGRNINQANPGVIFYYATFAATGSTMYVNQAIERPTTLAAFTTTMVVQSADVFTPTCGQTSVEVGTAPSTESEFPTSEGGSQPDANALKLTGLTTGTTYVLQVKYSVSSLAGATAPKTGNVFTPIVYHFQTWNESKTLLVAHDANGFALNTKK
jgi:hypothetical protein